MIDELRCSNCEQRSMVLDDEDHCPLCGHLIDEDDKGETGMMLQSIVDELDPTNTDAEEEDE